MPNLKNSPLGDWTGLTGEYEDKGGGANDYEGEVEGEAFMKENHEVLILKENQKEEQKRKKKKKEKRKVKEKAR